MVPYHWQYKDYNLCYVTNLVYNNMKFGEEILVLFYLDCWIVSGWVLTTCLNQYSYAMARLYKWRVWKANSLIWLSWLSWWKLKSGLEVLLEKFWLFFESTPINCARRQDGCHDLCCSEIFSLRMAVHCCLQSLVRPTTL